MLRLPAWNRTVKAPSASTVIDSASIVSKSLIVLSFVNVDPDESFLADLVVGVWERLTKAERRKVELFGLSEDEA